jgi:hypothetical protein
MHPSRRLRDVSFSRDLARSLKPVAVSEDDEFRAATCGSRGSLPADSGGCVGRVSTLLAVPGCSGGASGGSGIGNAWRWRGWA